MTVTLAYVGLGSNLDDPREHLRTALEDLNRPPHARLLRASRLVKSPPLAGSEGPDYVNAVAELETTLGPDALLSWFHAIEYRHGRRRQGMRWAARPLDLDLLLYGDLVREAPPPILPHPALTARPFVLYPLLEIAPALVVPGRGPLSTLVSSCPARDLVILDELAP